MRASLSGIEFGRGYIVAGEGRFLPQYSDTSVRAEAAMQVTKNKSSEVKLQSFLGAGGGTRTLTVLPPTDFESVTSTIPSHRRIADEYISSTGKIQEETDGIISGLRRDFFLNRQRLNSATVDCINPK